MMPTYNFMQFLSFGLASMMLGNDTIGFWWYMAACALIGISTPVLEYIRGTS